MSEDPPTVWIVDPISYSGMAYSDVGQIMALQAVGAKPLLIGSDSWMLDPDIVPRLALFRGTSGDGSRVRRGAAYVGSLARLLNCVRKSRPDIVHWQYTQLPFADVVTMLGIRLLGVAQVYTAHELLPWTAQAYHRWLFSRLYAVVDAVVVHNGEQSAELIRRFRVSPSKVHVAALGDYALFAAPDMPQPEARSRIGVPVDVPVALFFGTIRPSKGLDVLLRAWALVTRDLPEAILLVTGKPYKGMDVAKTASLIDQLGIASRMRTVFEQVDPSATNTYYRAADVVVLPYLAIGTSGVLRYAYNSARPVIATSVGEHTTHVVTGQTGFLIAPGDPAALADVLLQSLRDRSALRAMGEAALTYAAANFDWLDSAREILRVYLDLCR